MSYGIQLFPLCIVDGRSIIGGGQTHAISGGYKADQQSSAKTCKIGVAALSRRVSLPSKLLLGERAQGQALSIRALLDMTRKLLLRKSDT